MWHFIKDHPMNILAKFGSIWSSGFTEEDQIVKKSRQRRWTPSNGSSSNDLKIIFPSLQLIKYKYKLTTHIKRKHHWFHKMRFL